MPKRIAEPVRGLDRGTSAALRKSDMQHAARLLDPVVTEYPKDQDVTFPAGTLAAWREHVRVEHLEQLDEAGRLLPVGDVARAQAALGILSPLAEELDITVAELVEELRFGRLPRKTSSGCAEQRSCAGS